MTGWLARAVVVAVAAAVLLGAATSSAQEPPASPFQQVNGDGWITSNARFDGTNWLSRLPGRPSFGLQLGETNDIPFEHGTAGATFYVRDPGCTGPFESFGSECGWKLAMAVTQFRSLVVGGNGIEIDGLALKPPYGRILSASDGTERRFGITSNIYADWSGADVASAPRWFAGFDLTNDRYEISRGMTMGLTPLVTVDAGGRLAAMAASVSRVEQSAPESFAARSRLSAGRYTFAFKRPYQHVPVCVASSEGTASVRVLPTTSACVVQSSDAADRAMVDVQVTGDPD
jgi:hypothetical protein